ncbi:flagellar filament capping protein FliD [Sphingomonas sp. RS6]
MTTTSSTTSTSSASSSILTTLGAGSGIDTAALVDQLVTAQFENKNNALSAKTETLSAQISSVATLKSAITSFDSALKSLIKGGTLTTQPTSNDTGLLKVSTIEGKSVGKLSGTVEVRQLAAAQVANSAPVADASSPIGTGTLTLRFGTATVADGAMTGFTAGEGEAIDIAITSDNNSLQGIADAINAKGAGVTASILSDADGARLVLKSATGADQAFTLTATEDADAPGLAALSIGVGAAGTTIGSAAQDAIVAVDGVAVRRTTNSISDLIDGVKLDLVAAAPGTKVTLGTEAPTSGLSQAVSDFVEAYNQLVDMLKTATDPVNGALKSDTAAQTMMRQLRQLTSTDMAPGAASGQPHTLADLGVATARDGTLSVDSTRLASALASYPDTIEAMFKDGSGVSAALSAIATTASSNSYGLGASQTRYQKSLDDIAEQQSAAAADAETVRTRMTRQFANMDTMVASYKSTQSFLQQQIDAWNSSDS